VNQQKELLEQIPALAQALVPVLHAPLLLLFCMHRFCFCFACTLVFGDPCVLGTSAKLVPATTKK
jgi:hypothetical protein